MLSEPLRVVAELAQVFDDLGIRYAVGGSLASSMYGVPRATQDVDLVAAIAPRLVEDLAARMAARFHVDEESIRRAVDHRSSFNAVHLDTMFKADVFVAQGDAWSGEQLERARREEVSESEGAAGRASIRFASPEDTLLHKLVWYRKGGEVSDRQWSDICGILEVQGGGLEDAYLDRWAPQLGVDDLLARARGS